MIYDCVIIGAGLSGLVSSIILSKNGLKTALVEKSLKTGPLVRGFHRKGHYFDTGFHHAGGIGEGSSGRVILNYLGVSRHLSITPCDPCCYDVVKYKDSSFMFRFPPGYKAIQDRLSEVFPHEIHAIDKYIMEIKRQYSFLPFLNLDADFYGMNILEQIHGLSLNEYLSGLTTNQYLKSVLSVHCMLNGVPPSEQRLSNYAYIVGPYYESVNYIKGGGSALILALEKTAEENGVDIFPGMDADRLLFSTSGNLTGVGFKDRADISCRNIISTIHPLNFLKLVPDARFRPLYVNRIKVLDETPSAFILYGTSDIDLSNYGANVYLMPNEESGLCDYKKILEERPVNLVINNSGKADGSPENGFIMICPSSIKEVVAWEDSTHGNRPLEYMAYKEEIKERMLNIVKTFYPELNGKIGSVDCSTPLTLRDYSGSPFGSMYGAKHRIEQYNPVPVTRIRGVYLAGQSIIAPGLLGTMISAFLACGNILGHDFLRGELRRWN